MHARTIRAALSIVAAALAGLSAAGCYPDKILSLTNANAVTTIYDDRVKDALVTFALPDTVVHALQRSGSGVIDHSVDAAIVARIADGLTSRGWQRLSPYTFAMPDVVVLPIIFESPNKGEAYDSWWSDWAFWPGWPMAIDRAWSLPRSSVTFTYETGTLLIVMLDTRNGGMTLPVLWAGGVHGAFFTGADNSVLSRIDQAFVQSPYLERP